MVALHKKIAVGGWTQPVPVTYHTAMNPSVVILLAASGLPVPFSTTLKLHVNISVHLCVFYGVQQAVTCCQSISTKHWLKLLWLLPEAGVVTLRF